MALALGLGALPAAAWAQDGGTITGVVRNARTNQPLSGAQVVVEGTNRGTITGGNGSFVIPNVPAGTYQVVARSIGFQSAAEPVTVGAGAAARVDFALQESAVELEGIVVTGQGTAVEQRKLSTNVDVIGAREIDQAPVTDVGTLLQGRVPGASVNAVSAQPGQAPLIRFRGVTSVVGSQTPVIYIDGVRVDNASGKGIGTGGEQTSALAQILASDIERVEIIKGGAASTLYGSDAANGVIQIFTKRGIAGTPRITARIEQGIDQPETKFIQDVGFAFPEESYPQLYEGGNFDPDFFKNNYFKTGHLQNYYVGVNGGTEGTTYNVSGRIQNGTGVQPKNENTIYAVRGGLSAKVNEGITVDFTGSFTRDQFQRLYNGTAYEDPTTAFEVGDALLFTGEETLEGALEAYLLPNIDEEVSRFVFGTTVSYRPSAMFSNRFTAGVDYRANEQRLFNPIEYPIDRVEGLIDRYNRDFNLFTLEYAGTISYPREGAFTSDFTFGVQGFREDESIVRATGTDFALPGTGEFDAAANITAEEARSEVFNGGIFFQERVGLWDRLFLEGGLRLDGNSAFGEDVGLQAYPKLGASYNLSDEPWWAESLGNYANAVKLRVAYGKAGKFPPPFRRDRTYEALPFRGVSAPRFFNAGNPDLRPEVTATLEAGVDAGLFDNRLGIQFTFYNAVTEDALFAVAEEVSSGFRISQLRNVGEITNRGIELAANLDVVRTSSIAWNIGATLNTVDNEVTDLGGAAPFTVGYGGFGRVAEGYPVGAWYMDRPVDTNGDGLFDDIEADYVGTQPFPTRTGSISTDLSLLRGALALTALVDWARGATVLDTGSGWATYNGLSRIDFPVQYTLEGEELGTYGLYDAYNTLLLNGDYTKLREVTLRYAIPDAFTGRWGASNSSVYLSGRNLYTWVPEKQCIFAESCLTNLVDPELAGLDAAGELQLGGATSITIPAPRQFRVGVEVSF